MIQAANEQTLAAVNTALIDLYWQVGKTISARIASDGWSKRTVTALASYIQARKRAKLHEFYALIETVTPEAANTKGDQKTP